MNHLLDPLLIAERYSQSPPVPIFDILSEYGLGPYFETMDNNISGWIERQRNGSYRVAINQTHPPVRQRFTAAHELGHYIYHRDLLGDGAGDTRAYRSEGTRYPNAAIQPIHERQANSFAANFLMPKAAIATLRERGITSTEEMARRFDVSADAMRIRLGRPPGH